MQRCFTSLIKVAHLFSFHSLISDLIADVGTKTRGRYDAVNTQGFSSPEGDTVWSNDSKHREMGGVLVFVLYNMPPKRRSGFGWIWNLRRNAVCEAGTPGRVQDQD